MSTTSATIPQAGRLAALFAGSRVRELGILLALVIVVVAATIVNPKFLFSGDGWRDLLLTPAPLLLVTIGQAFVIITRNVDISVGSIVGLTAYMTGWLFTNFPGAPIAIVVVASILFGAVLGLVNGALVAFAKVPAMVITLGTLYAFRGINVLWTGSTRRTCRSRSCGSARRSSSPSRCSRSSPSSCSSPPPGTSKTCVRVESCMRSDPTPTRPTSTD
jgi:rhamnose transport system permease protein